MYLQEVRPKNQIKLKPTTDIKNKMMFSIILTKSLNLKYLTTYNILMRGKILIKERIKKDKSCERLIAHRINLRRGVHQIEPFMLKKHRPATR